MTEGEFPAEQSQQLLDTPAVDQASAGSTFVRQRKPHKTVEPVDDFAVDEQDPQASSGPTPSAKRTLLSSLTKDELPQLQHDVRYGNYLEVPRSSRKIFSSRGRSRHIKLAIAAAVVIAVVLIVGFVAWHLIQGIR